VTFPAITGWTKGSVSTTSTTASVTYTETTNPGTGAQTASVATNAGTSGTLNYTITADNTAPTVAITYPVGGTNYTSGNWSGTISGTASDSASGVSSTAVAVENTTTGRWWGGSSFNQLSADYLGGTGTTSWTSAFSASNLTAGDSYNVVAQATDGVGNVGTSSTVTFHMATFSETDLKETSCSSLTIGKCAPIGNFTTTNGANELILMNIVTSGSTSTASVSSLTVPFTSASQIPNASEQYPASGSSSSNENYLFAWQATGNGSNGTISATFANVSSTSSFGTVFIEVIQLGAGDTVVGSNADGGTTSGNGTTFAMTITPSSASDSEIAMVGTSSGDTFATPAGWTDISGSHVADWDSFSDTTIQSSATVTMSSSHDNWGYIALEINP
jgi:hypothetical protein